MAGGTRLDELRREVRGCTACPLYREATQAVFGEGPAPCRMMLVGEQPGDQEDVQGRPFVGPAGQVLDRALAAAGIDRGTAYVTNAVKHFKFTPRGKRRLHQKPDATEIAACQHWLLAEIEAARPERIVALGATAAQALLGRQVTIGRERGRLRPFPPDRLLLVTVHPSYILRIPDEHAKQAEYSRLVEDLRVAATGSAGRPTSEPDRQRSLF